jgi:hypothetical protein
MNEWSREVSRQEGRASAGVGRLGFEGGCWNGGMGTGRAGLTITIKKVDAGRERR